MIPDHAGAVHYWALRQMHMIRRPRTYLEIGTCTGESLQHATCPSIAVDPNFQLNTDVIGSKPACLLFNMGSDDFFRTHDPKALLGGPVDMAFLDGMHLFEYLLRDFANTERSCSRESVIFLHDCIPTDAHVARRSSDDDRLSAASPHPSWWAGDLWKTVLILQQHRPDLKIYGFDAPPTGLIAITNLDPGSDLIAREYFALIEPYAELELTPSRLQSFVGSLDMRSTEVFRRHDELSKLFHM